MHKKLNEAAEEALRKHRRLLHLKTLELVLSDMIREDGIKTVQELLSWYIERLDEF
jgi:hypothetical protein